MNTRPTLRIATLNILNNPSGFGKRASMLLEEIVKIQPDVINLQEVPSLEEAQLFQAFDRIGYTDSYSASKNRHGNGFYYGNVTLSRLPIVDADELPLAVLKAEKTPVAAGIVRVEKNGNPATIINAHLTWGSNMEWVRLRQAEQIADYAWQNWLANARPILLAGDLNSVPESSTVRFLSGYQEGTRQNGTLWIDAWRALGTAENEVTSDPTGYWGRMTAAAHNMDPAFIPKRRIDYIFSFGWGYGKTGGPVSLERFADKPNRDGMTASDHFGLYADILL